jgi:hypothetical protein
VTKTAVAERIHKGILNELLDWMDSRFDGDLPTVAIAAAEKAKHEGLISGLLWDEIGARTLHQIYRLQRIALPRRQATRLIDDDKESEGADVINSGRLILYYIGGRYYNLLDMTVDELKEVAAYYEKLSKSNGFERDYLLSIAGSLKKNQIVRDVFNVESLKELRREIVNN